MIVIEIVSMITKSWVIRRFVVTDARGSYDLRVEAPRKNSSRRVKVKFMSHIKVATLSSSKPQYTYYKHVSTLQRK